MSGLGLHRLTTRGGAMVGWRNEGFFALKVSGKASASWSRIETTCAQSEVTDVGNGLFRSGMTMKSQLWASSLSA
jgi:hypothetical protein